VCLRAIPLALGALALALGLPPAPAFGDGGATPGGADAAPADAATTGEEACLDGTDELGRAGARKGVQKRDFLKRLRGEISGWGGFFASDLLSSSYQYGGAAAFYITEDLGIEGSLVITPFALAAEKPLTQFFAGQTFRSSLAWIVVGNLLWVPAHFKVRASERAIMHGDAMLAVGAGRTFHSTAQGITFDVGLGLKFYPTRWLALRFDLRDYVIVQEAIAVQRVTNNLVGLAGLSLFLPGPWR
jgi:outer membrane beta-barrel protein